MDSTRLPCFTAISLYGSPTTLIMMHMTLERFMSERERERERERDQIGLFKGKGGGVWLGRY